MDGYGLSRWQLPVLKMAGAEMAIAQNVHRMFWLKDFFCIHIYHFTLNLCMQQLSSKMHLVLRKMFIIRVNANTIKIGDYIQNIWNKDKSPCTWTSNLIIYSTESCMSQ